MEKLHIEKNTIQETLVIPLYARMLCSELYPNLFTDPKSAELIQRLDYDFSTFEKKSKGLIQRFGALEIAMRQTDLAIEIREYLDDHPEAAVVNMGCGLDQTGENCYNGKCRVYNLDMPDIIEVRNQLLPPEDWAENIGCDLNDHTWFDRVDGSKGAVFFASGVFYYIDTDDVRTLVNGMAEHFPGGKLVLDTGNTKALKMMMKTYVKQAGIENIQAFFRVDDMDRDVRSWLKNGRASSKGYMYGYNDLSDPSISWLFRKMAKIGDNRMGLRILRFDFDESA